MKLKRDYFICIFAYILALFVVFLLWQANLSFPFLIYILFLDLAGTLVIFVISSIFKNASLYDPYWSVAPIVIVGFYVLNSGKIDHLNWIDIIIIVFISIWSIRLTLNWFSNWNGLKHEDWRYRLLREKTGKKFWFVNLLGIQIMPTILVYLGCLSIYPIFYVSDIYNKGLALFAIIITFSAILIETIADIQLKKFINTRRSREENISTGLWAYSRHPNYLGEIMFWWGLYVFNLSLTINFWWTIIGPLSITMLFLIVSIPMMEKKNLKYKPYYNSYIYQVPKLVPFFRRKK